jgi:hypothetical protein
MSDLVTYLGHVSSSLDADLLCKAYSNGILLPIDIIGPHQPGSVYVLETQKYDRSKNEENWRFDGNHAKFDLYTCQLHPNCYMKIYTHYKIYEKELKPYQFLLICFYESKPIGQQPSDSEKFLKKIWDTVTILSLCAGLI